MLQAAASATGRHRTLYRELMQGLEEIWRRDEETKQLNQDIRRVDATPRAILSPSLEGNCLVDQLGGLQMRSQ